MSWQAYVDNQLLGTGKIAQAAIYGHNGSLWATSPGFSLSPEEIKTLVDAFDNAEKIQSNGIYANGVKYFALSHDEKNIHGKKGLDGVVAEKTAQAGSELLKVDWFFFFYILLFIIDYNINLTV
ncbi:unnamed protein product [Rhizophagus irregularis]|nr:unnamed protein product [Rhizophagus irregularis]